MPDQAEYIAELEKKLRLIERRADRDRIARKSAEQLLETKSMELFESNQKIQKMADSLETQVKERTEELEIERNHALHLSKAKSEFVAVMSHEIRTPINAIVGAINLLRDEVCSNESIQLLDVTENASRLLLHIIDDILDYSKIEAGQMQLSPIPVNMLEFIRDIQHSFQSRAKDKGIGFIIHLNPNAAHWVEFDPHRLTQVINNYLSNAMKFTENGTVTLNIYRKADTLTFSVTDTGIGIPADKLDRLFKDFSQVDASTTRKYGGTGLGLVISKRLIEMMNGRVFVESIYGKGSTFSAEIPFKATEIPTDNVTTKPSLESTMNHQAFHILVVDDNSVNLLIAEKILKKFGFNVLTIDSGEKTIELLKQSTQTIDLILMDCQMPELSGFETTEIIREMGIQTPIIALTANTSMEDKDKSLNSGMNDFLTKPLDINKTLATIKQFLPLANP